MATIDTMRLFTGGNKPSSLDGYRPIIMTNKATNEIAVKWVRNLPTVQVTHIDNFAYKGGVQTRLQFSIPKVLHGHNAIEVEPEKRTAMDVADLLAVELPELAHYPRLTDWQVSAVDACAMVPVLQAKIPRVITLLQTALKSRADTFGVNLETAQVSNKSFKFKAYNKLAEICEQLDQGRIDAIVFDDVLAFAKDMLRIEASASRSRHLRRILTRMTGDDPGGPLNFIDACDKRIANVIMLYYLTNLHLDQRMTSRADAYLEARNHYSTLRARNMHRFARLMSELGLQYTRIEYGARSFHTYCRLWEDIGLSPYFLDETLEQFNLGEACLK